MRLATIRTATGLRAVRVDDGAAQWPSRPATPMCVRCWTTATGGPERAAAAGPSHALDSLDYAPLVPTPRRSSASG